MTLSGRPIRVVLGGLLGRFAPAGLGPRSAVHLAFTLAAAVLLLAGWTVYEVLQASRNAVRWVGHTQQVVQQITAAREHFAQMESAQRGYLLSGANDYLSERAQAIASFGTAVRRLEALTADNPGQQVRVRELERLAADRIRLALAHAESRRQQGFSAPWPVAANEAAIAASHKVYQLARQIETDELALLAQRQEEADARQRQVLAALAAAFVVGLLVLAPAYRGVLHEYEQRARTERRMSDLVEHLPVTAWQIHTAPDGSRRFTFVSERVQRERGLAAQAVRRDINVVLDSILDEDRPRVKQAMDHSEATLEAFDQRYRIVMPSGEIRWIHSRALLRREPDGAVLWSGFWSEITREMKLEQELLAANEALESFSYSASHDLRTPLAAIEGFSKALDERSSAALDDRSRHYLNRIRAGTQQMGELIDGLLLLGRVSQVGMSQEEVDLGALAAAVVEELRERDPGRRVAVDIEPGLSARGDRRLLRQVMANLVGNAWKFSAPRADAAIFVGRAASRGQRCFCVRDNGVGFDMAYAGRLFSPFQRLHSAAEFAGSGIGLATVQRILARHGGAVWAESAPGQGTSVYFTAPGEAAAPAAAPV